MWCSSILQVFQQRGQQWVQVPLAGLQQEGAAADLGSIRRNCNRVVQQWIVGFPGGKISRVGLQQLQVVREGSTVAAATGGRFTLWE